jgi:arginine decarboxylase
MQVVPSKFFITSGSAVSPVSDLNAFDLALLKADLSEQNLVAVSSVIPDGAVLTEDRTMPMGMVTFCVLSQCRGVGGETVSAGIAYAYRKDGHGGYVAEGHLHGSTEVLRKELAAKMAEMSRIRGVEFGPVSFVVETLEIPEGNYGCAVSSLVFTE